jgi:uncharacterized protein YdeI (YjbR/CyaY-like superfamily)
MPPQKPQSFQALLEAAGKPLYWTIARIPVETVVALRRAWPGWTSRRVRGAINGFAFRTTLFPGPNGEGLTLLVNKKMQAAAHARPGDRASFRLEPDLEPRSDEHPAELTAALKGQRALTRWLQTFSPSARREIGQWVAQPKSPEFRRKRALQMVERLLLVMEGEQQTPPILRVAFQREPLAQRGWQAMTLTQRRGHLWGIFGYQSVESRQRRTAQAVAHALRIARKGPPSHL